MGVDRGGTALIGENLDRRKGSDGARRSIASSLRPFGQPDRLQFRVMVSIISRHGESVAANFERPGAGYRKPLPRGIPAQGRSRLFGATVVGSPRVGRAG